jgi:cytidylate kinase
VEAIILSGLPACGKTAVAKLIGTRLGFGVVGGSDILKEMAVLSGYRPGGSDWWDSQEGIKFLDERSRNPDFDKEADRLLDLRIRDGNIVVTSYTAPWLSKLGYKIWLTASIESRAKRMAERDGTNIADALQVIKTRDEHNKKFYKDLYGIDFGVDMKPFNLVVNTDDISQEQVADKIIENVNKAPGNKVDKHK